MSFNHLLFVVCLLYCTSISYCTEEESFYDLTAEDIHGNLVKFDKYKGKVVVVVNVASECGFTDTHYRELSRLYDLMRASGNFEVLAFPCNQFGGQEPGDNEQILQFVTDQYRVDFPMFSKSDVYGEKQNSVFRFLQEKTNIVPNWNFWKFLVSHRGEVISWWGPRQPVEEMIPNVVDATRIANKENPPTLHDDL